jgi:RNA polymerase sigma-70 factor (family 1)
VIIYPSLTDIELIDLLKSADEAAFKEIYLRYDSLLYIYAYRKLKDKEEAKDVVQEVFIHLWNQRDTFILQTTLSGYLYKSVLNKVFNIFKHQNIVQQYINSNNHFIETDSAETDYLIREKDIIALIEKEIAAMPPRMREIYELKRKDFLTTKEIAEKLNISELTVSTQMKRALKVLKVKLGLVIYLVYIIHHR